MTKILHKNNIVSARDANKYIDWINDNLSSFLFLDHRQRHMLRFGFDQEYPEDTHYDLNILLDIKEEIINLLNKVIDIVKSEYKEEQLYVASFFISKHLPGSAVPKHVDANNVFNKPLHYSALIYLNELENSGFLKFDMLDKMIHPKTGDLVCFESQNMLTVHSVPDVSSQRYSIPIWLTRDQEFNLLQNYHV